ncbi:Nrps-like protein [Scedosporium apiospermum]|uniref:gluconokinase n=1 Tax=Pseudallescheria apiosperma TaxID=563466 RepID=A0A084G338_PSEDA|nr:Nrps-like protein [Scedosporium apiospermum]KEZ41750.1 Nrps-like protein [Scedosporium apiospermum]
MVPLPSLVTAPPGTAMSSIRALELALPQVLPATNETSKSKGAQRDDESEIQTVDQLVRSRAHTHADSIVVSYPSSGVEYVDYTMQQLDAFAYRVAVQYATHIPVRSCSQTKPTVVVVMGPSNLDYLVTLLALTKLGHTALLLSTRISQEAVDSLIRTTGAKFFLYDQRYADVAAAAGASMSEFGVLEIAGGAKYNFPVDVYADTALCRHLDPAIEAGHHVFIIHSSGSTGLPKPIYQTHKSALPNYAIHTNMKAFITLPLFHNHGICNMFRALHSVKTIALYNADLPLTQEYLAAILSKYDFDIFYGVPYALKVLSETNEGIALLRRLKVVMYGGSACPDDLGDKLVNEGVNLVGHYGATEVGQLMTSFRPKSDKAWNYVRESEKLSPYLRWIPRGPQLFECCVLPGWPAKVASNQPDGSYATKDLFEPHPTIPRAWRYVARLDDTIVLVNGEKFNPVSLEGSVRSNRNVAEAVVFGAGRPYLGICVIPSPALAGKSEQEIMSEIWPVIEAANSASEAYARIPKDMVVLLPVGIKYPQTDKGSVIRQAFYKAFAKEIDKAYDDGDVGRGDAKVMSQDELRQFLRATLSRFLPQLEQFDDDVDVFTLGLDSLQAIHTRSQILKSVDMGNNKLGQTVVFEHPSVNRLSDFLYSLRTGTGSQEDNDVPVETQMRELIIKYSTRLSGQPRKPNAFVVTGVTGSLGAHIASQLSRDPKVDRVYCLVRAKSPTDALPRIKKNLIHRRIYHTLALTERRKLVALPCDLSRDDLGLDSSTYEEIASHLSAVIHCAWSVNFNLQLSTFEKSDIAGVANLIRLCKAGAYATTAAVPASSTPFPRVPSFNFCSSVSAVARSTVLPIPETAPDLEWPQQIGYARSKYVAEHICERAGRTSGVPVRVLRVGQIIGDTQNGIWSASEAIPMMLQTATTIGALPRLHETPSWLPVDIVAKSVTEIATSEAGSVFCNVTNPRTFSWVDDLIPALRSAGLEFEQVEPQEWVKRLRASDSDPARNPPIKLVDFFASKYDKTDFSPSKAYATGNACSLSPTLCGAIGLERDLIIKIVHHFRSSAWNAAAVPMETTKSIIVVAGPCGSGKSTLATSLAKTFNVPYVEGDSLHSRDAVKKMSQGIPLDDEDRASWLERVIEHSLQVVRDRNYPQVVCEPDLLVERVKRRQNHYMGPEMVDSQVSTYEAPQLDETDIFPIDAGSPAAAVLDEAMWTLQHACGLEVKRSPLLVK